MDIFQTKLKRLLQNVDIGDASVARMPERAHHSKRAVLKDILAPSFTPWTLKTALSIPKKFCRFSIDAPVVKVAFRMQRVKKTRGVCTEGGILRRILHKAGALEAMLLEQCGMKSVARHQMHRVDDSMRQGLGLEFLFLHRAERIHIDAQRPRARLLGEERSGLQTVSCLEDKAIGGKKAWRSIELCDGRTITAGGRKGFEYRVVREMVGTRAFQFEWGIGAAGIVYNKTRGKRW